MTESKTIQLLEELVELQTNTLKLLAIPIANEADSQAQLVVQFSRLGIANPLIADILGTSYQSVQKAVNRAKKADGG